MKKSDSISIIVPVYNEENYISDCLETIARQSEMPDEVIVVDNNSTDNTVELAKKFPFVRVVTEHEQGRGAARRKGFDSATKKYLARIDADTELENDWVKVARSTMKDTDGVSGYISINDGSSKGLVGSIFRFYTFKMNRLISGHNITFGSNMIIRNDVWEAIKDNTMDSERIWEDLAISAEMNKQGYKIKYDPKLKASISIRASDNIIAGYKQLLGWGRTYWPYNKFAAVLAFGLANFSFITTLPLWPIIHLRYKFKQRG